MYIENRKKARLFVLRNWFSYKTVKFIYNIYLCRFVILIINLKYEYEHTHPLKQFEKI